jgi:hypothetical protein
MFTNTNACIGFAAPDRDAAEQFYGQSGDVSSCRVFVCGTKWSR